MGATAPSLHLMLSCTTTSSLRAAGKRPARKKLRRWKREQALFMQHWLEFFLTGDPWLGPNLSSECVYGALKITVLVLACC